MKRGWITRADVALFALLLLLCLSFFLILRPTEAGESVSVYVGDTLYATLPLYGAPDSYTVETEKGSLTLVFSDGGVSAVSSDCPDAVCVRTGKISLCGESIVCVPLGVSVTVNGEGLDGVTG